MAFCSRQCRTRTCCFVHWCVLRHLLCEGLPFNITLTCRRAVYPRPGISVCLSASDCFLIRKTLIYNLPCSPQCALQYRLSSLLCGHDLCWLALTEGAASCAGRKGASAADAGVGDGGCFTHEITRGFHFPWRCVSHSILKLHCRDLSLLLLSSQRAIFDPWAARKILLLCCRLKHTQYTDGQDKNQLLSQGKLLWLQ